MEKDREKGAGGQTRGVVFVVANGEMRDLSFLRDCLASLKPAAVICADGGARHVHALGMAPDIIVGDLDSLDPHIARWCSDRGARILRHDAEKDETDTELALEEALALAPAEICLFGALGRRLDHALANLHLLVRGTDRGVRTRILDPWCEAFVLRETAVLEGEPGQTVSLLPFCGAVTGVTLEGFAYPLRNAVMEPGKPYGVSNVLQRRQGRIHLETGTLLVIRYWRPDRFPGCA